MNFFEQQERARRKTKTLIGLFIVSVIGIILAINLVVVFLFFSTQLSEPDRLYPILFWTSCSVVAVIFGASALKWAKLKKYGGAYVAKQLGGKQIDPSTRDPKERMLLNVVEEMAIASGISVPEVFLLEENGINAFAAGLTPGESVIGMTRGSLNELNRDELQGVVAHEFSHIFNSDTRLNMKLLGALYGILVFSLIGRLLLYSGRGRRTSRGKRGGNQLALFGLALLIIGYIGVLVARIIQAAVSRQREFLADASAVQYTRNPDGIAGALKKIGGSQFLGKISDPHAEEMNHFFLVSGMNSSGSSIFATHPPLAERIRAIDPNFKASASFTKENFSAGSFDQRHLSAASQLLSRFSSPLREASRESKTASLLTYSIFLHRDPGLRRKQISGPLSDVDQTQLEIFFEEIERIGPQARLAILEISLPSLKLLSLSERKDLSEKCMKLIAVDQQLYVYEFALYKILISALKTDTFARGALPSVRQALQILLSGLAHAGTENEAEANAAFMASFQSLSTEVPELLPAHEASPSKLNLAIEKLKTLPPLKKKKLIEASIQCVTHNQKLIPLERELLRAVSESLEVPLSAL